MSSLPLRKLEAQAVALSKFEKMSYLLDFCCCLGIMTDELRNFLEASLPKQKETKKAKFSLGVAEPKVGSQISEVTKIPCQSNDFVLELLRGIRLHFSKLVKDVKVGALNCSILLF